MRRLSWTQRIGLALTLPCALLALVLATQAVWDARPLPACFRSGLDPFHPAQKCRRVTVVGGVPVPTGPEGSPLRMVEQGSVSGMPDFRPAGMATLAALALYLASRGFDRLWRRRVRPMTG
jgi:hypothetical protein